MLETIPSRNNQYKLSGELLIAEKALDELVIMIHWYGGMVNNPILLSMVEALITENIPSFRVDFNNYNEGSLDWNLKKQAFALEDFINHFKNQFKKIHLMGHSLGGASILYSNAYRLEKVGKIVLWDPAISLFKIFEPLLEERDLTKIDYLRGWGCLSVSKEMLYHWRDLYFSWEKRLKRLSENKEICIIIGEKSYMANFFEENADFIKEHCFLETIKGAGHEFEEEGKMLELIEKTLGFLTWTKE